MRSMLPTISLLILASVGVGAAETDWPIEAVHPEGKVIMYQPQLESFTENDIEARAAVSVTLNDETTPYFGAVWIKARVDVDRSARTVTYREIKIPKVRFPDADEEHKAELARFLEEEMPTWDIEDPLDAFIPLLEATELTAPNGGGIRHEPPVIIHSTVPTVLVLIDGKPRFQTVPDPEKATKKGVQRMVNTPFPIFFYPNKKTYYLSGGGDLWYTAEDAVGPYELATKKVPKLISELIPEPQEGTQDVGMDPPEIVVSAEPAELIVTDGEPDYKPVGELEILQLTNTESDILVDMSSRRHFVLLSGRWFSSPSALGGPWSFVEPGDLPTVFAEIPADSQLVHLRAHVPGTIEANEAALDATIPQTSAIQRTDTSLKVEYDGDPKFEPVEDTTLQYAVNSPQAVFKLRGTYYCCEQGVWYEAVTATGIWKVCIDVPPEIYEIPASNPHHNVTYVKVYDVTPEVVYVGYTPGYAGSYVYGGCVVWGTGWYYPGWHGRYYYPRPSTWGFHASYNPWSGWGFGVSWSNGPFTITVGSWGRYPYHGWWGPIGYRPPYYRPPYYRPPHYRPPHHRPPGHYPPGNRPPAGGTRPPAGAQPRPEQMPAGGGAQPKANLYNQDRNATRNSARPATSDLTRPTPANRPNDVFSDRSGNVYKRDQGGSWQSRDGGQWKPSTPSTGTTPSTRPSQPSAGTRPTQPSTGTRPSQPTTRPSQPSAGVRPSQPSTRPSYGSGGSSLNRDYGARSRSQSRSQQYRSAPRTSRPSGGARRR